MKPLGVAGRDLLIVLCCSVAVLFLYVSSQGQNTKTDDGRKLEALERRIADAQLKVDTKSIYIKLLLRVYTPDKPEIVASKQDLDELQKYLLALQAEKKTYVGKELVRRLPNTDIELLKVIALQNERIIDLLEQLASRPEK